MKYPISTIFNNININKFGRIRKSLGKAIAKLKKKNWIFEKIQILVKNYVTKKKFFFLQKSARRTVVIPPGR